MELQQQLASVAAELVLLQLVSQEGVGVGVGGGSMWDENLIHPSCTSEHPDVELLCE